MHYQAYQAHTDLLGPLRALARAASVWLDDPHWQVFEEQWTRRLSAACRMFALAGLSHTRPAYGIDAVDLDGERIPVTEQAVLVEPF
ncbi:MAG: polyhydroxyalkanoate depolymerase, partial [Burkholderiaceae bacterium]